MSFTRKSDAEEWARSIEHKLYVGDHVPTTEARKRNRTVPLAQNAVDVLRTWGKGRLPTGAVFPIGMSEIDIPWRAARDAAGLHEVRFHDLRHSVASYLAMSGASLMDIAAILGHKTLAMVKRYSHLSEQHTTAAIDRMAEKFLK